MKFIANKYSLVFYTMAAILTLIYYQTNKEVLSDNEQIAAIFTIFVFSFVHLFESPLIKISKREIEISHYLYKKHIFTADIEEVKNKVMARTSTGTGSFSGRTSGIQITLKSGKEFSIICSKDDSKEFIDYYEQSCI